MPGSSTSPANPGPKPTPKPDGTGIEGVPVNQLSGNLKPAFFDYDKADLRADARDVLAADATWLKAHPTVVFTIEGHCDERGTSEYNLALGERRAKAATEFLNQLGISAERMTIVSYGKERPLQQGTGEASWSKNRRDEFKIQN